MKRGEYLADIIDACYGDIPIEAREKGRSYERKIESFPAGGFAVYCIDSMHPRCILGMPLPMNNPQLIQQPIFPVNSIPLLSLNKISLFSFSLLRDGWIFKIKTKRKGETIVNNGIPLEFCFLTKLDS